MNINKLKEFWEVLIYINDERTAVPLIVYVNFVKIKREKITIKFEFISEIALRRFLLNTIYIYKHLS